MYQDRRVPLLQVSSASTVLSDASGSPATFCQSDLVVHNPIAPPRRPSLRRSSEDGKPHKGLPATEKGVIELSTQGSDGDNRWTSERLAQSLEALALVAEVAQMLPTDETWATQRAAQALVFGLRYIAGRLRRRR